MQKGVAQPTRLEEVDAAGFRARCTVSLLLVAVMTAFFDRIDIAILFTSRQFQNDIGVKYPAILGLLMTGFVLPYGASIFLFGVLGNVFGQGERLQES